MRFRRAVPAAVVTGMVTVVGITGPAAADDTTPYDVQVAWADTTHAKVRITWKESTPQANTVQFCGESTGCAGFTARLTAEEPDEVLVDSGYLIRNQVLRAAVNVGLEAAEPRAYSVPFDTQLPPTPVVTAANARYDELTEVSWRPGEPVSDTTPGDPLDEPQPPARYQLLWRYPAEAGWSPATAPSPATTAIGAPTLPERRNYVLAAAAAANEWGSSDSEHTQALVEFHATRATATWTDQHSIGGTVGVFSCFFSCDDTSRPQPRADRTVQLRRQQGSTWITVGSATTDADGTYSFGAVRGGGTFRIDVLPNAFVGPIHQVDNGVVVGVTRR